MRAGIVQEPTTETALPVAERRKHRRFRFNATINIEDPGACQCIQAHLSDLSLQGCHVVTRLPLPMGATIEATINKGGKSCAVEARVVYTEESKGMGLLFTAIKPEAL